MAAVLFDLDDTLFDHAHCARCALAAVRSSHACFSAVDVQELERSHAEILEELHAEVMLGRVDLDVARAERFRRLFQSVGVDADEQIAGATAATYRRAYVESRRAVAGAAAVLEAVRERARIGIVSNNLRDEQQEKLRHCALDRYVDVLMVSEEAGVSKPDPRIFAMALERLQCQPADAVMIGDSWAADIAGARAAGIRPIWFNPSATPGPDPDVPVISAFEPVADVVKLIFATTTRGSACRR